VEHLGQPSERAAFGRCLQAGNAFAAQSAGLPDGRFIPPREPGRSTRSDIRAPSALYETRSFRRAVGNDAERVVARMGIAFGSADPSIKNSLGAILVPVLPRCFLCAVQFLRLSSNNLISLAGGLGFEPRLAESESAVLPLDDPPSGPLC
jgi:hypothetical protein